MKTFLLTIILISLELYSFSQNTFDKSLQVVSNDLADKMIQKNKKKLVVLYITDVNKVATNAGKYMADYISYSIVNNAANFLVFDRENLESIVEAKKLIAEGYIDVEKAKELGRILAVEAIIVGNYTLLSDSLKLSLKALDSNSGLIIAHSIRGLPLNDVAASLLGINIQVNSNSNNMGFNTPIQSNENYNNPGTVNQDCINNNTGDFCFTNNTKKKLHVEIHPSRSPKEITLEPGQTQCFYNLIATNYSYEVDEGRLTPQQQFDVGYGRYKAFSTKGQIMVEKCKSKTLVIQ